MSKEMTVKPGSIFIFAPTGKEFKVEKVTDKRVSWYVEHVYPSSYKKMEMRMTWVSLKQFQADLNKEIYIIKQP